MKEVKEKVEELIRDFSIYVPIRKDAVRCALVDVKHILSIVRSDTSAIIVELQFWEAVEIELLNELFLLGGFLAMFANGNEPFYLAGWAGDPGRTLLTANAKRFKTKLLAEKAINKAVKDYPHRNLVGKAVEYQTAKNTIGVSRHLLKYSIYSSKVSWCPICNDHFYNDRNKEHTTAATSEHYHEIKR